MMRAFLVAAVLLAAVPASASTHDIPAIVGLTFAPPVIAPGTSTTVTVTFQVPAPHPFTVDVEATPAKPLSMPTRVNVSQGATTATFTATASTTNAPPSTQPVSITVRASKSAGAFNGTLTVLPAQVQSVTVDQTNIPEGASGTGTVTLGAASDGDVTVFLTSSEPQVTLPSSVTVTAGTATRAFNFNVTSGAYASNTVTVSAARQGADSVTKQTTFTVGPVQVASVSVSPDKIKPHESATGTVTLELAPASAVVVALSATAVSTSSAPVTVPSTVSVPAGSKTATFTVAAADHWGPMTIKAVRGSGAAKTTTVAVQLPVAALAFEPARIAPGATSTLKLTLESPASGPLTVFVSSSATGGIQVPSRFTVSAGATVATAAVTAGTGSGTASASTVFAATPRQATLVVAPATGLKSLSAPTTVTEGKSVSAQVTLDAAAPAGGVKVSLSGSGGLSVPAAVTVGAGQTSARFDVTATSGGTITATADAGTASKSAIVHVTANGVKAVSFNPASVVAGATAMGVVELQAPAGADGAVVKLAGSRTGVTVPGSVTVKAGESSARFSVATTASAAAGQVVVTASRAGQKDVPQAMLTVTAATRR